jgi:hypothetical protein
MTGNVRVISEFTGPNAFLSNFHIEPSGRTVEHRFQSAKPTDPVTRRRIMAAPTPGRARAMGRSCDLRPDWETVKTWVMSEAIAAKFSAPGLAAALVATAPAVLVEGNHHHDNEWGDCLCGRPACAPPGLNMLGAILMATRATIIRVGPITRLT